MKKLLLAGAAALLASPAFAADLPVLVAPIPVFNWTSCFMGAHVGGTWAQDNFTDPAALVENGILGTVVPPGASVGVGSNGLIVGGQMGCDYQFGFSPWVVGANLSGKSDVALPLGNPGDLASVTSKTDFLPSATVRVGYALANWLLYARAGGAWAGNKYSITGTFAGTPFGFEGVDNRFGWTAGAGVEWAFAQVWSVRLEYDYLDLGHRSALMSDAINGFSGGMSVNQSVQMVKLGVSFHMWAGQ
jgi:outer membrane immunogenic protein